MQKFDRKWLVEEAKKARAYAYTPYSKFMVGAALLADDGTVYHGCNIENAAYSPSNCAERTAFFKAISEGKRSFLGIAIVGAFEGTKEDEWDFCPPCGVCRQVMVEFCQKDEFEIVLWSGNGEIKTYRLEELIPLSFEL